MGALTSLWQFISGKCEQSEPFKPLSGKPSQVAKLGTGDAGAVKPPTKLDKEVPAFCAKTLRLMSRKKGVTVSEAAEATGKSKGSIYQEVTLIKKAGYKVYKNYEKASRSHRYTLG